MIHPIHLITGKHTVQECRGNHDPDPWIWNDHTLLWLEYEKAGVERGMLEALSRQPIHWRKLKQLLIASADQPSPAQVVLQLQRSLKIRIMYMDQKV